MQQTLSCLAAVLAFALFGLARQPALAADEQAGQRRETEAAALATAERWATVVRDAAPDEAGDYDGLDRVETARAGLGLVSVRVRIAVAGPEAFAASTVPATARVAVVTVTEVRADGRAPAAVTLPVRVASAGPDVHS